MNGLESGFGNLTLSQGKSQGRPPLLTHSLAHASEPNRGSDRGEENSSQGEPRPRLTLVSQPMAVAREEFFLPVVLTVHAKA